MHAGSLEAKLPIIWSAVEVMLSLQTTPVRMIGVVAMTCMQDTDSSGSTSACVFLGLSEPCELCTCWWKNSLVELKKMRGILQRLAHVPGI